jgi:hypothetical protein
MLDSNISAQPLVLQLTKLELRLAGGDMFIVAHDQRFHRLPRGSFIWSGVYKPIAPERVDS